MKKKILILSINNMNNLIEVDGLLKYPDKYITDNNNITSFKGRTINIDKPIYVYRNLNKKGVVYSIKQGGVVVAHTKAICIRDAKFVVNIKGKRRVMETKEKNVHAFIKGYYSTGGLGVTAENNLPNKIYYDPFIDRDFHMGGDDIMDVSEARLVVLNECGVSGTYIQTKIPTVN